MISVGAKPIAITNCLNFGNPEKEKNMGEFIECVQGIGEFKNQLPNNAKVLIEDEIKDDRGIRFTLIGKL